MVAAPSGFFEWASKNEDNLMFVHDQGTDIEDIDGNITLELKSLHFDEKRKEMFVLAGDGKVYTASEWIDMSNEAIDEE